MDHLGAGIGLLHVVGQRHRIKLAYTVLAAQHAGWIFPGNGRPCFDLRPGDFRPVTPADAALGNEVVDPALAVLITGIPVLHGRVFDLGIGQRDKFHNSSVKLVLIPLRRGAAFQIADI